MTARNYDEVADAVQAAVSRMSKLRPMVRVDPTTRASAAQMLMILFNGDGLATAEIYVPPLVEEEEQQPGDRSQMTQVGPAAPPPKPIYSDVMDWQH